MDEATTRLTVDKQVPGYWRVTLNHPPINTVDDLMYDEVFDLVQAIEAEPGLKVVTFESADPDYFLAHYGVGESQSRFGAPRWRDGAIQLAHSNVLSVAVIRGRARGGGSEFALGCDVRFASRERAIFGQPEVGFGLIPGGGATELMAGTRRFSTGIAARGRIYVANDNKVYAFKVPGQTVTSITLTNPGLLPEGVPQFSFTNVPGAKFDVFSTTNISDSFASWTWLCEVAEPSPGQFQFTDPQATNYPQRFYSVRSP